MLIRGLPFGVVLEKWKGRNRLRLVGRRFGDRVGCGLRPEFGLFIGRGGIGGVGLGAGELDHSIIHPVILRLLRGIQLDLPRFGGRADGRGLGRLLPLIDFELVAHGRSRRGARFLDGRLRQRLREIDSGIDLADLFLYLRGSLVTARLSMQRVRTSQSRDGFFRSVIDGGQLPSEQGPDLRLIRQAGEFLERGQRLIHTAGAGLPLRELEEPAPRVDGEALLHAQATQLAVELRAFGEVAKGLVTEGDCVVVQAGVVVPVGGRLVIIDGFRGIAGTQKQVSHPVVQPELGVGAVLPLALLEHPAVQPDGLLPLLPLLVAAGLVLQSTDRRHSLCPRRGSPWVVR